MPRSEVPVSRLWACLFAGTIFALLWTQKMKKTRKWIMIIVIPIMIPVGVMSALETGLSDDRISDAAAFGAVAHLVFLYVVGPVVSIYFMFRWTTEYNLRTFGHKSKGDWARAADGADDGPEP